MFFFFDQWCSPSPFGSLLCFLAIMQCVLISWSECLWKVTWKPPFHFSPQQFFQQASALRSNPLQSVPFDIQSSLLRGLNFLIHWVFVSASSAHHAQSPQLGADRLSPLGCCGSVRFILSPSSHFWGANFIPLCLPSASGKLIFTLHLCKIIPALWWEV